MSDKNFVLLQARLNSSRLYQKSLLPINDKSLVEQCYSNAFFNDKHFDFVVLIPKDKKSYLLEKELVKKNIKYFKGDENNVLLRFSQFLKDKSRDSIVIRLTADNPFVDKKFIKFCFEIFKKKRLKYFSSHENLTNTPYGLSLEIFKAHMIFESLKFLKDEKNIEHVTTYIRKKYLKNSRFFCKEFENLNFKFKLSIDSHQDYKRIKSIFEYLKVKNFKQLKKINEKIINENFYKKKPNKIVIGTVQLGKKYFCNNSISQKRADKILNSAVSKKVNFLDTASDYGLSEKYIGNFSKKFNKFFFISTKLSYIPNIKNKDKIIEKVNLSVINSLKRLKISSIEYFFIHDPENINNKTIINEIIKFKNTGIIKNLGISIYDPKDLKILKTGFFDAVQIPFNLFDHKFLKFIVNNKKYTIFVRSIFLRGNLTSNKIKLPDQKYNYLKFFFYDLIKNKNYKNFFQLTFSFLKYLKNINYIIVGFQNNKQMSVLKLLPSSPVMKKKTFNQILKLIKKSKIEKDIDLRFW